MNGVLQGKKRVDPKHGVWRRPGVCASTFPFQKGIKGPVYMKRFNPFDANRKKNGIRCVYIISVLFGLLSLKEGALSAVGCIGALFCFFAAVFFSLWKRKNAWDQLGWCVGAAFCLCALTVIPRHISYSGYRILFLSGIPGAVILYVFWRRKLPLDGPEQERGKMIRERVGLLVVLILFSGVWMNQINQCLDSSNVTVYSGRIVSRAETFRRSGIHFSVKVQFADEDHEEKTLEFPLLLSQYSKLHEKANVMVYRHEGALNCPYYSLAPPLLSK